MPSSVQARPARDAETDRDDPSPPVLRQVQVGLAQHDRLRRAQCGNTREAGPRRLAGPGLRRGDLAAVIAGERYPTLIQLMVDHLEIGKYDQSGLRNVLYGDSPVSPAVLIASSRAWMTTGHVGEEMS